MLTDLIPATNLIDPLLIHLVSYYATCRCCQSCQALDLGLNIPGYSDALLCSEYLFMLQGYFRQSGNLDHLNNMFTVLPDGVS